jgi:hypothetical protein
MKKGSELFSRRNSSALFFPRWESLMLPSRWPAAGVPPMPDGQERMPPKHARAGETHDRFDAAAHFRPVAMDWAAYACRLGRLVRTMPQPRQCVVAQGLTLGAQRIRAGMVRAAVQLHHRQHGALLASNSRRRVLRFSHGGSDVTCRNTAILPGGHRAGFDLDQVGRQSLAFRPVAAVIETCPRAITKPPCPEYPAGERASPGREAQLHPCVAMGHVCRQAARLAHGRKKTPSGSAAA